MIELADGGLMLYDANFLPVELADRYLATLRHEIDWEQKPGIFGHMQPRLIATHGDEGLVYRYSAATTWPKLGHLRFWRSNTKSRQFKADTTIAC